MTEESIPVNNKEYGVIIGRFQPFHLGHEALIERALQECEQVFVFIGSSNKLPDFNNPFTNEERKEFILRSFPESETLNVFLLHDKPMLSEWVGNVYGFLEHALGDLDPEAGTLYTAEKDADFYKATFLFNVESVDVGNISGTYVRKGLYDGDCDMDQMPKETASLVTALAQTNHFENMRKEFVSCKAGKARAIMAHAFRNPIEPVVHAVVTKGNDVLLVKRNSVRGMGQWALPGGFLEHGESTQAGALRELKEETGVDLSAMQCAQLAVAVEENLDDLSTRTLGINFLFAIKPGEEVEVTIDPKEVLEYKWCPITDITSEKQVLFYNHNVVVQRLIASMGAMETPEAVDEPAAE